MQSLESRYNNFIQFCLKIKPDNEYVQKLQTVPMPFFLKAIKDKYDESLTEDNIVDIICEKCGLIKSEINPDDLNKLKRYIDYFGEIVRALE